ncbi:MAG: DUF2877 domain-containing protein [Streptosporangiaceae bacterium]
MTRGKIPGAAAPILPSAGQPSTPQPSAPQPSKSKPGNGKPSNGKPSNGKPSDSRPGNSEHSPGQHSSGERTAGPGAAGRPRAGAPATPPALPSRAAPRAVPGVASLALHRLLREPLQAGRVIAVLPDVIYLDFGEYAGEPQVIALTAPGVICPPNAITLKLPGQDGPAPPAGAQEPARPAGREDRTAGREDGAWVGNGRVLACGMDVQVRRWWDPSPVVGPLSRGRLEHGVASLARVYSAAEYRPGLDGHDAPAALAARCAAGDLASAVEVAESLVGLGPGLTPSGDSMISGLLLALRLLGGATPGGTKAVWLADWLGAAVTCYAEQRTTALAATLLHCAARGQAAEEVSAVLRAFAGQKPVEPAARRLLTAGRATGAELTWGLIAGCGAALALSVA